MSRANAKYLSEISYFVAIGWIDIPRKKAPNIKIGI